MILIGDKLRKIRLNANINGKDVAKELGISQQQYSNIENNISPIDEEKLLLFAKYFGLKKEDVLNFGDSNIFYQNNHDNSIGHVSNLYTQNNDLIIKLLENNSQILDLLSKQIHSHKERLDVFEDLLKRTVILPSKKKKSV